MANYIRCDYIAKNLKINDIELEIQVEASLTDFKNICINKNLEIKGAGLKIMVYKKKYWDLLHI